MSELPYIQSAFLCIQQAKKDCDSAIDDGWQDENWTECIRNLIEAKWQIESAISKVQRWKEENPC